MSEDHERTRKRWSGPVSLVLAGLVLGAGLTVALFPAVPGREVQIYINVHDMTMMVHVKDLES